jgi:hypothetical protein
MGSIGIERGLKKTLKGPQHIPEKRKTLSGIGNLQLAC